MIDSNPDLYLDFSQFNQLRRLNRSDEEQALHAAAKQMEGVFLNMMLQSMRDANAIFSEGNMLESRESEFYQGMYDKQLVSNITSGPGIGLAEVIVRQLSKQGQSGLKDLPASFDITSYQNAKMPAVYRTKPSSSLNPSERVESGKEELEPVSWNSPQEFIQTLLPYAEKAAKRLGVGVKAVLAQAALETGWGQHVMPNSKGDSSHNFFGIKADTRWDGDVTRKNTLEYRNGIAAKEVAPFRSYESLDAAFNDYVSFLKNSDRYGNAVEKNIDEKQWGYALQKAGYATDPNYGNKIASIIDSDILQSVVNGNGKKI